METGGWVLTQDRRVGGVKEEAAFMPEPVCARRPLAWPTGIPPHWCLHPVQPPPLARWWDIRTHSLVVNKTLQMWCLFQVWVTRMLRLPPRSLSPSITRESQLTRCGLLYRRASWWGTDCSSQQPARTGATGGHLEVDHSPARPWGDRSTTDTFMWETLSPRRPARFLMHRLWDSKYLLFKAAKFSANLLHSNR